MKLYEQIEILRIGALCGIYTKKELVDYLEKLIIENEDVPYEIIEASLCSKKTIDDISMKLREYTGSFNIKEETIEKNIIHIIRMKYYENKISLDDCVYYLYNLLREINLTDEVERKVQYLSDGLYLAEQDIYGDIETIKVDFEKFIEKY